MATTQDALLLREAVNAAKSGNKAGARQMLRQASVYNPNNELVWLWRASLAETPKEAMFFLGEVLRINPKNEKAAQWLEKCKPHVEAQAKASTAQPARTAPAAVDSNRGNATAVQGSAHSSPMNLHQAITSTEPRAESRTETRPESRNETRQEVRPEARNEARGRTQEAPRTQETPRAKDNHRPGESATSRLAEAAARLVETTRNMPRGSEATARAVETTPHKDSSAGRFAMPAASSPATPKPPEPATTTRTTGGATSSASATMPSPAKKPAMIPFAPSTRGATPNQAAPAAATPAATTPAAPASKWRCPFCNQGAEASLRRCGNCRAVTVLEDLKEVEKNEGAVERMLRDAIARLEQVKPDQRKFEQHLNLSLAHLNLREATQAIPHLKAACALQRNNWNLLGILDQIQWRKVVLVVDDSLTVRKALSSILEKNQYRVVLAEDGSHALNRLNEAVPDLVLLDITMPFMDGYQVCKVIKDKAVTKKVPVVMLSGKDGLFDKVRGKLAGANDYVTKPFDPDNLLKVLKKYLSN